MKLIKHSSGLLEANIKKDEFEIVWISDLHFDSKYSMWDKVKKYLVEHPNTYIVIGGDSIDVMQFVNDKRGSKSDVLSQYNETDYANRVINTVKKEIVEPFKDRIISWNRGNHDNSILKHHNIDLLSLICGVDVHISDYTGYILINGGKVSQRTQLIHFSHSPYSGGTRSKGSLSIDIAKAEAPSADIWITEHIHNGFIHPVLHEEVCTNNRTINMVNKWYVQNIAAKQESQGPRNGFHYETNKGNRVSGIVKMRFKMTKSSTYKLNCSEINHIVF